MSNISNMAPTGTVTPSPVVAAAAAVIASATAEASPTLPPWFSLPKPEAHEWNGGTVVPVAIVSAVVATIFVGLRFYTRACILRTIKWEDWAILTSLFFAIATSGGTIAQLDSGLGRHLYYVYDMFSTYVQTGIFTDLCYSSSLALTKVSILLLYIRILTSYEVVRTLSKVLVGVVAVSHAWIVVSILTTCIPLSAAWGFDPDHPPLFCQPVSVFEANACLLLATDFLIFILPLPILSSLRLPRKQKIGLVLVFCLAFLVCGISIVRLVGFFITEGNPDEAMDVTWSAVRMADWTCIEVHAAIVTACLPTLKALLCSLFPNLMSSSSTASPATDAGALKDCDENYSTGDIGKYQRPLTIGTKSTRAVARRDTLASFIEDIKEHHYSRHFTRASVSAAAAAAPAPASIPALGAAPAPATSGDGTENVDATGSSKTEVSEFRLAEVDAGGPLRWPSLLITRASLMLQVPRHARTRGSTARYETIHE